MSFNRNAKLVILSLFILLVVFNVQSSGEPVAEEHTIPLVASLGGNPPSGYEESNFTLIEINEDDIVIEEQVTFSDSWDGRLSCYTNLSSYPNGNENGLWHIRFPDSYDDVSDYYIRRTAFEVYYCFYDEEGHQNEYQGTDTYWEFPADSLTMDILRFTISTPPLIFEEDKDKTSSTNIEYVISIDRLINTHRTYEDVLFSTDFTIPFEEEFEIYIYDETGGSVFMEDITDSCNLQTEFREGDGAFDPDTLNVQFDMGTILSYTDYTFRIRFATKPAPDSFFSSDNMFLNIIAPIMSGVSLGYLTYPSIMSRLLKRPIRQGKKTFIYSIPVMILMTILSMILMYFLWLRSVNSAMVSMPLGNVNL